MMLENHVDEKLEHELEIRMFKGYVGVYGKWEQMEATGSCAPILEVCLLLWTLSVHRNPYGVYESGVPFGRRRVKTTS